MKIEVIIAIISGAAGVVGALIASIQALRTSRLKAKADLALEQIKGETHIVLEKMKAEANIALETMKEDRERRQKAYDIASQESAPFEAALAQAWEDIQTVKEIISKLSSAARYDLDLALEGLNFPSLRLREGYAKWGSSIPEEARRAWHSAKGSVANVEQIVINQSKIDNAQLPAEVIDILKEARTFLTDHQMVLATSRQGIRDANIKHLLEVI